MWARSTLSRSTYSQRKGPGDGPHSHIWGKNGSSQRLGMRQASAMRWTSRFRTERGLLGHFHRGGIGPAWDSDSADLAFLHMIWWKLKHSGFSSGHSIYVGGSRNHNSPVTSQNTQQWCHCCLCLPSGPTQISRGSALFRAVSWTRHWLGIPTLGFHSTRCFLLY